MQIKNLALFAAALTSVSAEFAIFTVPLPKNLGDALGNPQSFASSVKNYVTANIASATASAPASALSRAASAQSALVAFAKTASVSIPSAVTEVKGLETFTSVPAWYSALPSDVKSYYDENNSKVQALVNQAILGTAAPSGSAQPSATNSAGAKSTGAASSERVVQYVGAGVAAGFAGLMAL